MPTTLHRTGALAVSQRNRIVVAGYPDLTHAVRQVVEAAVNQRRPSPQLVRAVNAVLDAVGDPLSTKQPRKRAGAA